METGLIRLHPPSCKVTVHKGFILWRQGIVLASYMPRAVVFILIDGEAGGMGV